MSVLFLFLFLSACYKDRSKVDDINYEYDSQICFYLNDIAMSENGYYYVKNGIIRFFDKRTKISLPLCSKINCNHDENNYNCSANISNNCAYSGLWYSNRKIYVVLFDTNSCYYYFESISLDGNRREKVCNMFRKNISAEDKKNGTLSWGNDIRQVAIHRGYGYYVTLFEDNVYRLYRVRLRRFAKPELIYEADYLSNISCYSNSLYFSGGNYNQDGTYDKTNFATFKYDIEDGSIVKILNNYLIRDWSFCENNLFFSNNGTIYKLGRDNEELKKQITLNESGFMSFDGKYFYFDNYSPEREERSISVMDKNFNIIDNINLDKNYVTCFFGDEDYMFLEAYNGDEVFYVAFDKSQIEIGKNNFIKLK